MASEPVKRRWLKDSHQLDGNCLKGEAWVLSIEQGVSCCPGFTQIELGKAWSPAKFLQNAKELGHPFASTSAPDEITQAVFDSLISGPKATEEFQAAFKRKWEARAAELKSRRTSSSQPVEPDVIPFAHKKDFSS